MMTFRFDPILPLACVTGCLFLVAGCGRKREAPEDSLTAPGLTTGALVTHARYVRAVNAAVQVRSDEIAPEYWTEEIRKLRPIRVYRHRGNIVVVQKISPGREEGTYICPAISSYVPRSGEDGFEFMEVGNSVCDFTRVTND